MSFESTDNEMLDDQVDRFREILRVLRITRSALQRMRRLDSPDALKHLRGNRVRRGTGDRHDQTPGRGDGDRASCLRVGALNWRAFKKTVRRS